jgi:hypothetical protein
VEGSCEHGSEPSGSQSIGKFLGGCATDSFSRRAQLRKTESCNDALSSPDYIEHIRKTIIGQSIVKNVERRSGD